MAFNQLAKKSFVPSGVTQAFVAPWTAYQGSKIALSGVTGATIVSTAGLVLSVATTSTQIEWASLAANIQTGITTNLLTVATFWQVSQDATNWTTPLRMTSTPNTNFAPAGTASLVTTSYVQYAQGLNPSYPYVRLACQVTTGTGAAGDNVVVSYNWRARV